jgi:KDO2-lipid IV(A) lauroyltransferase
VLRVLGKVLGLFAFAIVPHSRRLARRNIARAFPSLTAKEAHAIARRSYLALGGHLGDAVASLDTRRPLAPLVIADSDLAVFTAGRDALEGEECGRATCTAADALEGEESGRAPCTAALTPRARGILFASAHLGPWERVAATLVARGIPLTVLARETYDPRLGSIYDRLRGARGIRAIYRGRPGAATGIVRTLRAGGVLGVPMDLRSRVPSVEVLFLGQKAWVPVGPARIALKMNAAVIVGTVVPDPAVTGGLRIRCAEIPTADLTPGDSGERELTARLAAELSRRILALPAEWVWMHDRFPALKSERDLHAAAVNIS